MYLYTHIDLSTGISFTVTIKLKFNGYFIPFVSIHGAGGNGSCNLLPVCQYESPLPLRRSKCFQRHKVESCYICPAWSTTFLWIMALSARIVLRLLLFNAILRFISFLATRLTLSSMCLQQHIHSCSCCSIIYAHEYIRASVFLLNLWFIVWIQLFQGCCTFVMLSLVSECVPVYLSILLWATRVSYMRVNFPGVLKSAGMI